MENFLELACTRRSIRKYEEKDIPDEDLQYFIDAAVSAPSGCNCQCWRFVAIRNKDILHQIHEAAMKKIEEIVKIKGDSLPESYLASKRKAVGFFTKAPVAIAVFMTKYDYYDKTMEGALREQGYDDKGIIDMLTNFDLLSIGAAVQNLLLAVHEKGYGACWMNEPAIAGAKVNKILGVPQEHRFISLIPIGKPLYTPMNKKMKDIKEVFSIL